MQTQAACRSGLGLGARRGPVDGAQLPPGRPVPSPRKGCPSVPAGGVIGQPGDQRMHVGGMDSIPHTTLVSSPQPWEGNMPSGRHPDPTKRPLLELEVRICGRWDSWVRVPAPCQSPGRWANISGIKRSAACPTRRMGARCCWAQRLHCLCQSSWEERGRGAAPRAPRGGAWSPWSRTPGFCSGPGRPLLKTKLLS